MPVFKETQKGHVPVKIFTNDIAHDAFQQLINLSQLPIVHGHIAAMPDVHLGVGATVGSVIPTQKAVIPAAVGVDIGCGMNAVRLSLKAHQLPDNLRHVRATIEDKVPVGFNAHKWTTSRDTRCKALSAGLHQILEHHPKIAKTVNNLPKTWICQMGTLGGGNHFIELCVDESQDVWIMLHSGSRGIGNAIGQYFIALARRDMEKHIHQLPDKDLAYFSEGAQHFDDYINAVHWAQEYALENRREMMTLILSALRSCLPEFTLTREAINCHHNYVSKEQHSGELLYITRKGAIRAGEGELGIIPGSMGAKSYVVRGKGNPESFCSCSHGAGRKMSRNEAKRQFDKEDLERQTRGVECRKDKGVIDEIPGAYKDIDQVMENQRDLVEVVHTLKQVLCIKG